ncbi:helix-turn-helix transcriptional regulator [Erwinia sp. S43]|uniref:helix-turn-helix domain-containing protein n=1 Tax=unclassified Erwinia TaxID=2622719 RepID=UPI00190E413F|nr:MULTISPECIES: helix-turn-helix transcriptional regulator [unclassified Erwinia]MBK0032507.1 helix-turn-helix transcriptional regulator [Erwinia sp. S43]MCW1873570.1 helix-turn-helix domain-containing protein [Erwinia sp. INIA01]
MLPQRLKQARTRMKISQQKLGILAGIDEATASTRMNQYERGIHTPDFELVCRLAAILHVPACYFYTQEDELADIIEHWYEHHNGSN